METQQAHVEPSPPTSLASKSSQASRPAPRVTQPGKKSKKKSAPSAQQKRPTSPSGTVHTSAQDLVVQASAHAAKTRHDNITDLQAARRGSTSPVSSRSGSWPTTSPSRDTMIEARQCTPTRLGDAREAHDITRERASQELASDHRARPPPLRVETVFHTAAAGESRKRVCLPRHNRSAERSSRSPHKRRHRARCYSSSDSISPSSSRMSTDDRLAMTSRRSRKSKRRDQGRRKWHHRRSSSSSDSASETDERRRSPTSSASQSLTPKRHRRGTRERHRSQKRHTPISEGDRTRTTDVAQAAIPGDALRRSLSSTQLSADPRFREHPVASPSRRQRFLLPASMDRSLLSQFDDDDHSVHSSHTTHKQRHTQELEVGDTLVVSPEEDFSTYSKIINKVAQVMELQVELPDPKGSCKFFGHL
ncbi:hypothetical protein JRQ81_000305 [Phrynocephalus forsythii]|uniref:Uncharacterized protein n=1 Tax=Phrynocephalus forsythii TaxID=171643 RepID=A0A9Q1B7U6_9SAUR|nr:hypothetical protein JRQ81_000305 [Phrynocephalus forsythii]